jgi:stage II sporulation protein D
MSQWGAYGYANHGWTYDQILGHYYTGTSIGTASGTQVRVLLQSGRGSVSFAGATMASAKSLRRKRTYTARRAFDQILLRYGKHQMGSFAAPLRIVSSAGSVRLGGPALNGISDGAYRGGLELGPSGGGLMVVNVAGVDDYARGVVPGEVSSSWPAEALKAQAVAARSYGLATHVSSAFDQYPDTRSQVYRGMGGETASTNAAVDATAGQVVRYGSRIAVTYFFSASGGHTENVENVFYGSAPAPYLRGVPDPYDGSAPRHRWTLTFTKAQVQARLGSLVKGSFRGIQIVKRGASPRIVWADVVGSGGRTRVRGTTLRARLGLFDSWAKFPALAAGASHAPAAATSPAAAGGATPGPAPARSAAPTAPAPSSGSSAPDEWQWPAATWRARTGRP